MHVRSAVVMDAGGKPSHIGLTSPNTGTPSDLMSKLQRVMMCNLAHICQTEFPSPKVPLAM
jgi:hypothetical protein